MSKDNPSIKRLAANRRARHDYHILDKFEAGIALLGTEVKAVREGRVQLKDSYIEIKEGEAFLVGAHISPYSHGNRENHDPERRRKLLLKRREIDKLSGRITLQGQTCIPLSVYLKGNLIKLEIALAKGKKLYDKRQAEKTRTLDKEAREAMAERRR
ncbi:MAG: SsrA-binding protein SmpB [Thermoanaerobaculia bacterium]